MTVDYANLPTRVKALIVDQLILIAAMYAVSEFFGFFDSVSNNFRIMAFLVIFLIYEPLFISFYGGTIGHSFCKITVKSEQDLTKNLNLILAVIRFLIKVALGWLSLLTIVFSDKKMAIHDMVVKSVVIEANEN